MKEARPRYPRFALCGLNCGLCPMYHISESSHCTGCGGEGRPTCPILRCSEQHGQVEFCSLCEDYPCERYQEDDPYDSFLPTRNVRRDLALLQEEGLDSYRTMLDEKVELLKFLLAHYNDGRRKTLFCTAINLLPLADCREVTAQLQASAAPEMSLKEKGALAASLLQAKAEERQISLKLRRKK